MRRLVGAFPFNPARKVSGYRKPAPVNQAAFEAAVDEVAAASQRLLEAVTATHPARRAAS